MSSTLTIEPDVAGNKKKKLRFSTSLGFSHRPPYKTLFAERVPLLHAFALALGNYQRAKAAKQPRWRHLLGWRRRQFVAVECGVYTGSSLIACGSMARDAGIPFHFTGLDTFEGLPDLSEKDISLSPENAAYLNTRLFADTSMDVVRQKVKEAGLARSVELRKGLFADVLPTLPERRYDFVNIDCDLYEPHLQCLEYFYSRVVPGGVIFFDDYHSVDYPMARHAVDEFMRDKPERLAHLRFGDDAPNRTKTFFVKY